MIQEIDMFLEMRLSALAETIRSILEFNEQPRPLDFSCKVGPSSTCRLEVHSTAEDAVTRIELKYFAPFKSLTIQNVIFDNRRQGTMTEILNLIKNVAEDCSIDKIIIESVLSPEMSRCALKNGFQIQESSGSYITASSFFNENDEKETFFGGNYVYEIGDTVEP